MTQFHNVASWAIKQMLRKFKSGRNERRRRPEGQVQAEDLLVRIEINRTS
ncbi:hypothetical protein B0H94_10765 [Salsuginibacillus halophilus]|uniref:Uncharacterized protein n=1 Tax=Salsuginibacillus halophilus TaxID=517424 RepID=A0A2P8HFT3_9BACI|nr:hypothetical protein B0H94_10765 [Salsuginibacillus halophilus]